MDTLQEAMRGPTVQDSADLRPLRVLLVEDSSLLREAVAELIETGGNAFVAAAVDTEAAALTELQCGCYDVVIVDLRLREGSGFGALRALQDLHSVALPIVLTNYATPAIRRRCTELGAAACFDKSSEFEMIGQLIARRAATRSDR